MKHYGPNRILAPREYKAVKSIITNRKYNSINYGTDSKFIQVIYTLSTDCV